MSKKENKPYVKLRIILNNGAEIIHETRRFDRINEAETALVNCLELNEDETSIHFSYLSSESGGAKKGFMINASSVAFISGMVIYS